MPARLLTPRAMLANSGSPSAIEEPPEDERSFEPYSTNNLYSGRVPGQIVSNVRSDRVVRITDRGSGPCVVRHVTIRIDGQEGGRMRLWRVCKRLVPAKVSAAPQPVGLPPPPPPSTDSLVYELLANLALRDLTVVERLLSVISDVERGEQDPERLAFFYALDHDITRLRRSAENALVLAGAQAPMGRSEPMTLLDVVRAAASETADYTRVSVGPLPAVSLGPAVADDLAHTLAELMDNALNVSPTRTLVKVSGGWANGGVLVTVEDEGIGIPPELLPELNSRLTGPLVLDMRSTRQIGLYVVAHLARRHGIYVQLQTRRQLGSAAVALLPGNLVLDTSPAVQPAAVTPAPARISSQPPMSSNSTHLPKPANASVRRGYQSASSAGFPSETDLEAQPPLLDPDRECLAEQMRLQLEYEKDPLNPQNPIPPAVRTFGGGSAAHAAAQTELGPQRPDRAVFQADVSPNPYPGENSITQRDRPSAAASPTGAPTEFTSEGLPRRTRPARNPTVPVPARQAQQADPASVLSDLDAFTAGAAEALGTAYSPVVASSPSLDAPVAQQLTDPAQEEF